VESNPDAVKARTLLGKIYEDRNEFSKAIDMYRKAISFSPKTVLVYERLARDYLLLGQYREAKDIYTEGLRQVPSSPEMEEGIEMADMLLIGDGGRMP
jgi:tetratricopeptide (TPR) repeat protein